MNYPTFPCDKCSQYFTKIYSEGDGFYCWRHITVERKRFFFFIQAELDSFHRKQAAKDRNRAQFDGDTRFSRK